LVGSRGQNWKVGISTAKSIINKKKGDDNLLIQGMTDLMTPVIFRGLVCDWLNEKTLQKGGFL